MTRSYVPPPAVVAEQMKRVRALGRRLEHLADAVQEAFEEVHEGGHWSASGGSITQMHRANGSENNPTRDAVFSGSKVALRRKAVNIASLVRKELEPVLDRIDASLAKSYLEALDQELAQQVRDNDAAAREYDRRRKGA
jgi:hypothetical protein